MPADLKVWNSNRKINSVTTRLWWVIGRWWRGRETEMENRDRDLETVAFRDEQRILVGRREHLVL